MGDMCQIWEVVLVDLMKNLPKGAKISRNAWDRAAK